MPSHEVARMLVDMNVPRTELVRLAHGMTPAKLAEVVAQLSCARDRLRLQQDARPQDARQSGARDQCQGRPAADGRRCRDRGRIRLRRGRDDHASRAQRLVECASPARSGPRSGAGGTLFQCSSEEAEELQDRHGRLHLLRRNGLRLRHREEPSSTATTRRGRKPFSPRPMPRAASRCAAPRAPAPSC